MKAIAQFIRANIGRKCVEPGYANHITEKGQTLADIYHLSHHEFEDNDKKVTLPVVWANAEEVISTISDAREFIGKVFVKVMADGGQNFLKICLSILPEDYDSDNADTEDDLSTEDLKKRATYEDGGGIGVYKLTSVKRVIMLAIVPECKETHFNMKVLFDLTQLNNISFLFVADFKQLLICLGCQTASASFPCPYYLVALKDLTPSDDVDLSDVSNDNVEERTFGNIEESHDKFVKELASNRKKAKLCNSTVESSLLHEDPELRVIDKCPPEELHMMQGFVNHTFWKGLCKVIGREKALEFPKLLGCAKQDYHGEVFEGNACREMLRMQDRRVLGDVSPLKVLPYVRTYKAMDKLVGCCFGSRIVDRDEALDLLNEVMMSYLDTGLSVTLKLHVIFYHLLPALQNPILNGRGLGKVSGQAGESIHSEFKEIWKKYKINSIENKRYGENLLKAVIEFSSKHI